MANAALRLRLILDMVATLAVPALPLAVVSRTMATMIAAVVTVDDDGALVDHRRGHVDRCWLVVDDGRRRRRRRTDVQPHGAYRDGHGRMGLGRGGQQADDRNRRQSEELRADHEQQTRAPWVRFRSSGKCPRPPLSRARADVRDNVRACLRPSSSSSLHTSP